MRRSRTTVSITETEFQDPLQCGDTFYLTGSTDEWRRTMPPCPADVNNCHSPVALRDVSDVPSFPFSYLESESVIVRPDGCGSVVSRQPPTSTARTAQAPESILIVIPAGRPLCSLTVV
jgi:hypothetical protein